MKMNQPSVEYAEQLAKQGRYKEANQILDQLETEQSQMQPQQQNTYQPVQDDVPAMTFAKGAYSTGVLDPIRFLLDVTNLSEDLSKIVKTHQDRTDQDTIASGNPTAKLLGNISGYAVPANRLRKILKKAPLVGNEIKGVEETVKEGLDVLNKVPYVNKFTRPISNILKSKESKPIQEEVVQATPTQATPVKEPQTPAQPTQPAKVNETPKPKNDVSKLREAVERKSSPTPKTTSNNTISIKKPNTRGVFGKERDKILENYKKKLQEAQSSQPQAKPQEEPVNQTPVVKEVKPTNISSFGSMSITNQKKVLPSLTKADLEHVLARALKRIEKPRKEGTHGSQYLKNQEERQEIIPLIRKRIEELEDNLKKNK